MEIAIHRLGPGDDDAVAAAQHLFDGPADPAATRRFLAESNHHLLIAYARARRPVGFVSGVEITHPDKGTELLLYELGVDAPVRRRGIGQRLVAAFAALARERGCTGMWVLVDDDNVPALATYAAAGGRPASSPRLLEWSWAPAGGDGTGERTGGAG